MWRTELRILALLLVLVIPLAVSDDRQDASAGTYSPCIVPPTIGGAVKPNVLFVMDYSGSMQGPAYYPPADNFSYYDSKVIHYYNGSSSSPTPVNGIYSRFKDYSGCFAINKYYKYNTAGYFEVSSTKPAGAYTFAVDKIRIYKVQEGDVDVYVAKVWTQTSFQNQLQVNDPVCFENLTKKEFLTKNSWVITSINTATYKDFTIPLKLNKTYVEDPVDGTPDSGNVFKRVAGSFQNGYTTGTTNPIYTPISGNAINYLSASRYDNALMALIGGRADVSGDYATLKPLGARAHLYESSEFRCTAHMYPSTSTTTDYNSGFILDKTTRLIVSTTGTGTVSSSSPQSVHRSCNNGCSSPNKCTTCQQSSGVCGQYLRSEVWTFTLTQTARVTINMAAASGSAMNDPFLKLYNGATPSGAPIACDDDSGPGVEALIDMSLAAGTYSIEATTWNGINGTYVLTSNVALKEHPTLNTNPPSARRNEWLGNVSDLWCKLRKPKSERSGIVQQNMAKVRFGFIMFRGSPGQTTAGKIMVPLHNTSVDTLVNAFQGVGTGFSINYADTTYGVFPYSGTPTGEAMNEALYYLQQSASMGSMNTAFKGTGVVDPYKGLDYKGDYVAVPCRKSFVVLISDGIWSSYMNASGVIDPVEPAYAMHHTDLRTDAGMTGDQLADVYAIYAFGEEPQGRNSMKEVAMYGGFTDKNADGWPYPRSGYPTYMTPSSSDRSTEDRSCNLRWPLVECCQCPTLDDVQASTCSWKGTISACGSCNTGNPSCLASLCPYPNTTYRSSSSCSGCECTACGQYNETDNGQCQEWATKTYENTSYIRSGVACTFRTIHGVPTNYFQASDGAEIEDALTAVLAKASQQTGAAGSVATVSQKYQGEDLVVRAAFEAADPDRIGGYKWYGHLETYLPFQSGGDYLYDFDMPCNVNKVFCKDMPGDDPGTCHTPATCWDAGEMLKTLYSGSTGDTDRKLLTLRYDWNAGKTALVPYKWEFANFPKWGDISGSTDDRNKWRQLLSTTTDEQTQNLIYWIRGSAVTSLRDREGNILGDIVYSTPVVVGSAPPMGMVASEDPDFQKFLTFRQSWVEAQKKTNKPSSTPTTEQKLKKMVYVGGNDGMLHAFVLGVWDWDNQAWIYTPGTGTGKDPDIGKELWSYIPSNLLSQMRCLAEKADSTKEYAVDSGCNHRYMVDLSPGSFQVYITSSDCKTDVDRNGSYNYISTFGGSGKDYRTDCVVKDDDTLSCDGKCWRTIIVGGQRGGGDLYFAVDVTNPDQPKLLWEFSMIKDLVEFQVSGITTQFRKPELITGDPFYELLKILPMSWSRAQVGRLTLPTASDYKFYVSDPPDALTNWSSRSLTEFSPKGDRHLVFVGGGFRIFQDTLTSVNGVSLPSTVPKSTLDVMRKPRLLAIDVETGQNVFRYLWPYMIARTESELSSYTPRAYDPPTRGSSPSYYVPYAMGDPALLDVWDLYSCERDRTDTNFPNCKDTGSTGRRAVGSDGYVDHLYVGDMNGYFYAIKFVDFQEVPTATPGIWVDVRPTKGLDETTYRSTWLWSRFRSRGTPVTTQASVAIDRWDTNYLRVIFGTGKYDDIPGEPDDKTDPAKMALYNIKDAIMKDPFTLDASGNPSDITIPGSKRLDGTGIGLCANLRCLSASTYFDSSSRCTYFAGAKYSDSHDTSKCNWAKSCTTDATSGTRSCVPDCCESANSTCAGSVCWGCLYDLRKPTSEGAPGERFTTKPLIAGGLVFITSYVPASDPCLPAGQGYLYAFDYTCSPFPDGFQPFNPTDSPVGIYGTSTTDYMIGQVVNLGAGVPSAPVLDSSGKKLIIQMSDGKIRTVDVNLLMKPLQVKGWRERTN